MIFVTVGTIVLPFDSLIRVAGELAVESKERIVVQHGTASWAHAGIDAFDFLPASVIDTLVMEARVVASHGGVGTIATCLRHHTPVVVLPRRRSLGEQVDDHQEEFVLRLARLGFVHLVADANDLKRALHSTGRDSTGREKIGPIRESRELTFAIAKAMESSG